eukprot:7329174-Pyramimonas_sp.AAC.1
MRRRRSSISSTRRCSSFAARVPTKSLSCRSSSTATSPGAGPAAGHSLLPEQESIIREYLGIFNIR